MEISETIYEDGLYPSYEKITRLYSNLDGHRRQMGGVAVTINLAFDGYMCNNKLPLVRIDGHLGVVLFNVYLKVMV